MLHTKKYIFLITISLSITGCATSQTADQQSQEPQIYHEIETKLTEEIVDDLNPAKSVEEEIERLKRAGTTFWHDNKNRIEKRTAMHHLKEKIECNKQSCSIIGILAYENNLPPDFVVDNCKADGWCSITEPEYNVRTANNMKRIVEFFGMNKDIYTIGSRNDDDNYTIYKNAEEIFSHQMFYGTESVIAEAYTVMDEPVFTFFDLEKWDEENKPVYASNILYKDETLNEKYDTDSSSYLFSYKDKLGFVGEKFDKKFVFFNGHKISQDFDEIRTHGCCAIFPYPIEIDKKGILQFLAKRGEKYFIVEINLNEYLE